MRLVEGSKAPHLGPVLERWRPYASGDQEPHKMPTVGSAHGNSQGSCQAWLEGPVSYPIGLADNPAGASSSDVPTYTGLLSHPFSHFETSSTI